MKRLIFTDREERRRIERENITAAVTFDGEPEIEATDVIELADGDGDRFAVAYVESVDETFVKAALDVVDQAGAEHRFSHWAKLLNALNDRHAESITSQTDVDVIVFKLTSVGQ